MPDDIIGRADEIQGINKGKGDVGLPVKTFSNPIKRKKASDIKKSVTGNSYRVVLIC